MRSRFFVPIAELRGNRGPVGRPHRIRTSASPTGGDQEGGKALHAAAHAVDGQPDLEGTWQPQSGGAIYSVLPHPGGFFLGAESKTGIVEGGVLPYQPWAAAEVTHLS